MNAKKCVLDENKICDDCGECNYCDLNPFKICDNCGKCIGMNEEYREIKIDEITNLGAVKIRLRSLFEALKQEKEANHD